MAKASPSGDRHPSSDLKSFLSGPGLRIALGVGAGYIARRLWTHPEDTAASKLALLRSAPTVPISSLKDLSIPGEGQLVILQNGVVTPLSSIPSARHLNKDERFLYTKAGEEAVLKKTVEYTDAPKEFGDVYEGFRRTKVYRVPFALEANTLFFRSRDAFVIVKNAYPYMMPMKLDSTTKSSLNPPVELSHRVVRKHEKDREDRKKRLSREDVATSVVQVKKVTEESVLRAGVELENVFGRLRIRNGMAEIEPSDDFPKRCFTMSRSEIKREIREKAKENEYPIRGCSVGVGLVSLGLIFSGLYSYAS